MRSNGMFQAPEHRVRASGVKGERFSAPFFFNPPYDLDVVPLPGLVHADGSTAKIIGRLLTTPRIQQEMQHRSTSKEAKFLRR